MRLGGFGGVLACLEGSAVVVAAVALGGRYENETASASASASASGTGNASLTASATRQPPASPSPSPSPTTTATGYAAALQCSSSLASWSQAFTKWSSENELLITTTYPATTYTYQAPYGPPIVSATRLTTLCDGHPRVVGDAQLFSGGPTAFNYVISSYDATLSILPSQLSYPTPSPTCIIEYSYCAALQSQAFSTDSSADIWTICNPDSDPATSDTCTAPMIVAKGATLFYWPVRTVSGDDSDLCKTDYAAITVPAYGPTAAPAANTAIVDGMTLTSPTVGISFQSLSRLDGCGATISNTLFAVPTNQPISSIWGARALFQYKPFEYQDLNYRCQLPGQPNSTIQDGPGPHCYQQVPAQAYFSGLEEWAYIGGWPASATSALTIANDYAPRILPPSVVEQVLQSLWGSSVSLYPDGVWDPPRALQSVSTIAPITPPHPHTASETPDPVTTAQPYHSASTSASPGWKFTALPETRPARATPSSARAAPPGWPTGVPYPPESGDSGSESKGGTSGHEDSPSRGSSDDNNHDQDSSSGNKEPSSGNETPTSVDAEGPRATRPNAYVGAASGPMTTGSVGVLLLAAWWGVVWSVG